MRAVLFIACFLLAGPALGQGEFWCWNADLIQARVNGHTVDLQHLAALYNCCPDPITYDITVGDATIMIEEHAVAPCDCNCCMDLELVLANVPPGPWVILFRWFDLEVEDWIEEYLEITVPDVGQGPGPVVTEQSGSGCLSLSGMLDTLALPRTWGAVKALYE